MPPGCVVHRQSRRRPQRPADLVLSLAHAIHCSHLHQPVETHLRALPQAPVGRGSKPSLKGFSIHASDLDREQRSPRWIAQRNRGASAGPKPAGKPGKTTIGVGC